MCQMGGKKCQNNLRISWMASRTFIEKYTFKMLMKLRLACRQCHQHFMSSFYDCKCSVTQLLFHQQCFAQLYTQLEDTPIFYDLCCAPVLCQKIINPNCNSSKSAQNTFVFKICAWNVDEIETCSFIELISVIALRLAKKFRFPVKNSINMLPL